MLHPFSPGPVIGSAAGLRPLQNVYKGDFVFWEILAERRNGEECQGEGDIAYSIIPKSSCSSVAKASVISLLIHVIKHQLV